MSEANDDKPTGNEGGFTATCGSDVQAMVEMLVPTIKQLRALAADTAKRPTKVQIEGIAKDLRLGAMLGASELMTDVLPNTLAASLKGMGYRVTTTAGGTRIGW